MLDQSNDLLSRAPQVEHVIPSVVVVENHVEKMTGHEEKSQTEENVEHKKPYRAFNFSAGPAALPTSVMTQAQQEFMDWHGTGMGIMEMSHRDVNGPVQNSIMRATTLLRQLLEIPDSYDVFFAQGGAHGQFAAVPLNLTSDSSQTASYLRTGFWSTRAMQEAEKFCQISIAGDAEAAGYRTIPDVSTWDIPSSSAYTHICANETIHGLEFVKDPDYPSHLPPLVCDMTSTLLSRPVDISKYGVIYASGGKNLGPAGFVVVIARKDLVKKGPRKDTPSVLSWASMAQSLPIPSIYNTPPTFLIYMCELVLEDLVKRGGLKAMEERAIRLSSILYEIIDLSNGFYSNNVSPQWRSRMNVPFRIAGGNKELEKEFTLEAGRIGLQQVFGHPLFGGQRITLYNGIPDEGVYRVAQFMKEFAARHSSNNI